MAGEPRRPNFFDEPLVSEPWRPRWTPKTVVGAGIASACVMGLVIGLWARPAMSERKAIAPMLSPIRPAPPPLPDPKLEVIVDETRPLPPPGAPMEVLPAFIAAETPTPIPPPEPAAPPMVVAEAEPITEPAVEPRPAPKPAPAKPAAKPKAPAKVQLAKAAPPKPAKARPKPPAKVELARKAAPKREARPVRLAARDAARAGKPAAARERVKPAAVARRADRKAMTLARRGEKKRAAARGRDKPTALAKRSEKPTARVKLAARTDVRKLAVAAGTKPAKAAPVKLAAARSPRVVEKARYKAAPAPVRREPEYVFDDRRVNAAYARAAAAGVSTEALRRQQARWKAARDAAAREAPWAVPEVYEARIAELEDQEAMARDGYRR